MTKAVSNIWAQEAERLQGQILKEYEAAVRESAAYPLEEYTQKLNSI